MNSPKDQKYDDGSTETQTIDIKSGSCWLEGDNRYDLSIPNSITKIKLNFVNFRLNSTDSRNYGQIPLGLIKSKVLARIYPFDDFRIF